MRRARVGATRTAMPAGPSAQAGTGAARREVKSYRVQETRAGALQWHFAKRIYSRDIFVGVYQRFWEVGRRGEGATTKYTGGWGPPATRQLSLQTQPMDKRRETDTLAVGGPPYVQARALRHTPRPRPGGARSCNQQGNTTPMALHGLRTQHLQAVNYRWQVTRTRAHTRNTRNTHDKGPEGTSGLSQGQATEPTQPKFRWGRRDVTPMWPLAARSHPIPLVTVVGTVSKCQQYKPWPCHATLQQQGGKRPRALWGAGTCPLSPRTLALERRPHQQQQQRVPPRGPVQFCYASSHR